MPRRRTAADLVTQRNKPRRKGPGRLSAAQYQQVINAGYAAKRKSRERRKKARARRIQQDFRVRLSEAQREATEQHQEIIAAANLAAQTSDSGQTGESGAVTTLYKGPLPFERIAKAFEVGWHAAEQAAYKIMIEDGLKLVQRECPVVTGQLRRSYNVSLRIKDVVATSSISYAQYNLAFMRSVVTQMRSVILEAIKEGFKVLEAIIQAKSAKIQ